jgi:isoleucyl-tRNA synthetase
VVDGEGKKMSKSRGNVVVPEEVIKKFGAEILRLWVSAEDYRDDIRISPEIIQRLSEAYRRLRNTARFLLGNLYDFDPARDGVPYESLREIDRFALHRMQWVIDRVRKAYETYTYHIVFHTLHQFCVVDLSALYLDILKDTLYVQAPEDPARRSAQTVLFEIARDLTRLMAPILAFTSEEIWEHLPPWEGKEPSVHLSGFPQVREAWTDNALGDRWEQLLKVRGEVTRALELARKAKVIGLALDARVVLGLPPGLVSLLGGQERFLEDLFIVSQVETASDDAGLPGQPFESSEFPGLKIWVAGAVGAKCPRCWKMDRAVGEQGAHCEVCPRCSEVLRGLGG